MCFSLIVGRLCLVKAIADGVSFDCREICQASAVSTESAGLNTFKFGIDLNPASCSIG